VDSGEVLLEEEPIDPARLLSPLEVTPEMASLKGAE
jgi:hypothetical protein